TQDSGLRTSDFGLGWVSVGRRAPPGGPAPREPPGRTATAARPARSPGRPPAPARRPVRRSPATCACRRSFLALLVVGLRPPETAGQQAGAPSLAGLDDLGGDLES